MNGPGPCGVASQQLAENRPLASERIAGSLISTLCCRVDAAGQPDSTPANEVSNTQGRSKIRITSQLCNGARFPYCGGESDFYLERRGLSKLSYSSFVREPTTLAAILPSLSIRNVVGMELTFPYFPIRSYEP